MAKNPLMFTRPDRSCGKVFYTDRRAAEEHRIALEVWKRATGGDRYGYRLSVYQCVNCGGFHVGQKRIENIPRERSEKIAGRLIESAELSYLAEYEERAGDDVDLELDAFSADHQRHPISVPAVERGVMAFG